MLREIFAVSKERLFGNPAQPSLEHRLYKAFASVASTERRLVGSLNYKLGFDYQVLRNNVMTKHGLNMPDVPIINSPEVDLQNAFVLLQCQAGDEISFRMTFNDLKAAADHHAVEAICAHADGIIAAAAELEGVQVLNTAHKQYFPPAL